ncbi:MAG: EAL domain-containing protein [Ectothiorhodospiraceae bacterium]
MACPGCEIIPTLQNAGKLYIAPRLDHTRAKVHRQLNQAGWTVSREEGEVLAITINEGQTGALLDDLSLMLSRPELDNCPSLLLPSEARFGLHQLRAMEPLGVLVARQENSWLGDLLREERLQMHFQPILHADSGTEVFAYEALARGIARDGSTISPGQMFPAARAAELMYHIDRAARVAAIRQAHEHGISENVFINFNPTSLYDPVFCLRTTFDEVERLGTSPEHYVFEVVETDLIEEPAHLDAILQEYRRHGFRVALDDLGAGYGSLDLMQKLRPDFVKLDRELVDGVSNDEYLASITSRLIDMARSLGVKVIAEGIETRADWAWLQGHSVDLVQGFYFARPAATPPRIKELP